MAEAQPLKPMPKKRLSKTEVSKLIARDLMVDRIKPMLNRAIPLAPVAPKVEKVATSRGKTSKVNILKLQEEILDELRAEQLNF